MVENGIEKHHRIHLHLNLVLFHAEIDAMANSNLINTSTSRNTRLNGMNASFHMDSIPT